MISLMRDSGLWKLFLVFNLKTDFTHYPWTPHEHAKYNILKSEDFETIKNLCFEALNERNNRKNQMPQVNDIEILDRLFDGSYEKQEEEFRRIFIKQSQQIKQSNTIPCDSCGAPHNLSICPYCTRPK